jgi:hypothetical protein
MPDEPDHPIEGELRAWAESRRAAQPPEFELHAATRRMLHGEAARVHGKAAAVKPAPAGGGSFLWWRSVLVGATVAFAIGCVIWVSLPARGPMQLAKSGPAVEPESAAQEDFRQDSTSLSAMDAAKPEVLVARTEAAQANEAAQTGRSLALNQPAAEATASSPSAAPMEPSKDLRDEPQAGAMLAFSVPPPALAPLEKRAGAEKAADASAAGPAPLRQRFQQTAATAGGAPLRRSLTAPEWPVLREFELAVSATNITVNDWDGSVYSGALAAEPAGTFVVTGTNLTLGEAVRFEGAVGRDGTNLLRVTGRAQFGQNREIQVDAAPVPPR